MKSQFCKICALANRQRPATGNAISRAFAKYAAPTPVCWEADDNCGGITFDDVAKCAKSWGLFSVPRIHKIDRVLYAVLKAAGTNDAEEFNPENIDDDN